jgi:type II secretory pathway pseudopilin PulG
MSVSVKSSGNLGNRASISGFAFLEMVLVVAVIGIFASIVIIAVNQGRQSAATRNAQRHVDVNTILGAIYQYSLDHDGSVPSSINTSSSQTCSSVGSQNLNAFSICKAGTSIVGGNGTCNGIDLEDLTEDGVYAVSLPTDPSGHVSLSSQTTHTGYFVIRESSGHITVCAPDAENGEIITVTR